MIQITFNNIYFNISVEKLEILKNEWCNIRNKISNPFLSIPIIILSNIKAFWTHKCSNEECNEIHVWEDSIYNRINGSECQYCLNKRTKYCVCHSLLGKYPEIAKEWDYEKNGDLRPEKVKPFCTKKVFWKHKCSNCDEIHNWNSMIKNRTISKYKCPICALKTKKCCKCKSFINTHKDTHQYVINEIDYEENEKNSINIYELSSGSEKKIYWKCMKDHKWFAIIKNRISHKTNCPICFNLNRSKGSFKQQLLKNKYPSIFNELHPTKNDKLDINKITFSSNKNIWWICKEGHEWKQIIRNRTSSKNSICKECNPNLLKNKYPYIFNELHPTKNDKLDINKITFSSKNKVWWKHKCPYCDEYHEWKQRIDSRTIDCYGCNICSLNRKICCKCKSIATTHPYILKEWNYEENNNLKQFQISSGSGQKIHWICSKSHKWIASPNNRIRKGTDCPSCNNSKGEKEIEKILQNKNIKYEQQKNIGNRLRFDFYLSEYNLAIEFDGYQHFKAVIFFGGDDNLKKQQINDRNKDKYCLENKIHLLRIHYDDIKELEDEIDKCINKLSEDNNSEYIIYKSKSYSFII